MNASRRVSSNQSTSRQIIQNALFAQFLTRLSRTRSMVGISCSYQLMISADILRGRYREGFTVAKPIQPNTPLPYQFDLPTANHVFFPGHRIMVQVQAAWFPLYDRNPQTFVPNIMFAKPGDYQKAEQRIYHTPDNASYIELPLVKEK